jgi:hypothetical protein
MPEIKILISRETHSKLREAQRLAGISEQRLAVGAFLEWAIKDFEYRDMIDFYVSSAMIEGLEAVRAEVLRGMAK